VGIFLFGAFSLGGFEALTERASSKSFCISCHEMEKYAYEEFKMSAHDVNRSGVSATCQDCHVPRDIGPMIAVKLRAADDLLHHFLGTVNTKEKYDGRRLIMAELVWRYMKETDSRECRNCHAFDSMDLTEQQGRAARKHRRMEENGQTCIDCHKGIAHNLPVAYDSE
jgi:cytochrome c-type protein NapC